MTGALGAALLVGAAPSDAHAVFVDAEGAAALIAEGAAVLDARGGDARAPYLPGAVVTSWRDTRAGLLREGRLAPAAEARAHYAGRGVRLERPVVVYGAGLDGWGEEGRVWWDLRVLGHEAVVILDGGLDAWRASGRAAAESPAAPSPGDFAPRSEAPGLRADAARVLELMGGTGTILDTRTREEFGGATPYMSSRGGHVPGARPLHWESLLDAQGRLRSRDELLERLRALGVRPDQPTIAYCTGGVRSAFVVAVLTHLGLPAENYDGSWWDWSSRDELPVADTD